MMNRRAIGLVIAVVGLCGCASTNELSTARFPLTCTNQNGFVQVWTSMQETTTDGTVGAFVANTNRTITSTVTSSGGTVSVQESVAVGGANKLVPPPPVDVRQIVWGSIADGMDPVDAARMFGPWTIMDQIHETPAQLARAQNPATYGWTCHS